MTGMQMLITVNKFGAICIYLLRAMADLLIEMAVLGAF